MKKHITIPGILGLILLLIALIFRWLDLPNQIIIILAGTISLFLIAQFFYTISQSLQQETLSGKLLEWFQLILTILLTVLVFFYFYGRINRLFLIPWAVLFARNLVLFALPGFRGKAPRPKTGAWLAGMFAVGLTLVWLTNPIRFQIPHKFYNPPIENPAYPDGDGPIVLIDEAHFNFHTISGRYYAFAKVLRKDGYQVQPLDRAVSRESLGGCKILVIANSQNEKNVHHWINPIYPAFTGDEVDYLEEWVRNGGSLFLIADHMPMPGAVSDIGERFGFIMHNGFNMDSLRGPDIFTLADSTLVPGPFTDSPEGKSLDSIPSFTGHAFEFPPDATPVLVFRQGSYVLMPDTAWNFNSSTPRLDASGMSQLAYKKFGDGKIVLGGEAAMFSSQYFGGLSWKKGGMGSPVAGNNYKLLLNIIHWLDSKQ